MAKVANYAEQIIVHTILYYTSYYVKCTLIPLMPHDNMGALNIKTFLDERHTCLNEFVPYFIQLVINKVEVSKKNKSAKRLR